MVKAGLTPIPERRSSRSILQGSTDGSMLSTPGQQGPHLPAHATPRTGVTVPARGGSTSPIRRPNASNLRRAPSRTFVPSVLPPVNNPRLTHSRVNLAFRLRSPIFMGGATVEGEVHIAIDGGGLESRPKLKKALSVSRISVTLVGIERCKGRQEIFRALMYDLIDRSHPPPTRMAPFPSLEGPWDVVASESILPFRLDLPVDMGPPPYDSKKVGISYCLSALLEFKIAGKMQFVRESQEIIVLTVHDPEKALVNLASPLLASDELHLSRKSNHGIRLTAGLHRQTWISGYPVFIDIHIENKTSKAVKRVDLQLERTILFYNYSAPSTGTKSADVLRLPDHLNKEILVSKVLLDGGNGVRPLSEDFRTCQLELPAGLVSIETGRFFGIRFFVDVQVTCSFTKNFKVQLPITIVHPNSIDIPPNALAQVAASIDHKHSNLISASGSPYRYRAGRAFQAARGQSYLQLRKDTVGSKEMEDITNALECSPRRMVPRTNGSQKKLKVKRRQSAVVLGALNSTHQHLRSQSSLDSNLYTAPTLPRQSFETNQLGESRGFLDQQALRVPRSSLETKVISGLRGSFESRGPRLQRSTSGMAFDDSSDKENFAPKR